MARSLDDIFGSPPTPSVGGKKKLDDIFQVQSPQEQQGSFSFDEWKKSNLAQTTSNPLTPLASLKVTGPLEDAVSEVGAAGLASTKSSLSGLSAFNPLDFKPQEFGQRQQKALTEPIILNKTNINPFRANQNGQVDTQESLKQLAGTGLKGTAGAFNVATLGRGNLAQNLGTNFGWNALAGAGVSLGQDIKQGASPQEAALNAAFSGATQGITAKLPSLLSWGRNTRATAAGIDDLGKEVLSNPENSPAMLTAIDDAKTSSKDVRQASPLEKVGQEIEKAYQTKLKPAKAKVGQQIGDILEGSTKEIDITPAKNKFIDSLKKLGVKVLNGVVDTSESAFASNEAARKQIEKLGQEFYNKKSMTPTAIANRIRDLRDVLGVSKESISTVGTTAKKPIKDFVNSLDDLLKTFVPEIANPQKQYASLSNADKFFAKNTGNNKASSNIFKRLYATGRTKALLPAVETLSELSGRDFINEGNIAKTAMDVVGDTRSRSLLQTTAAELPTNLKKGIVKTLADFAIRPQGAAMGLIKEAGGLPDKTKELVKLLKPLAIAATSQARSTQSKPSRPKRI